MDGEGTWRAVLKAGAGVVALPGAGGDRIVLPALAAADEEHDGAEEEHDEAPVEVDVDAEGALVDSRCRG